ARLLPIVVAANVNAITARFPKSPYRERFDQVAQWVTGNAKATAEDGVEWLQSLCAQLAISSLSAYGVKKEDFDQIVAKSKQASSMKGNPITLSDQELH